MIEAGVLGKEAIEDSAQKENAGTLELLLADRDRYLGSATDADPGALTNAAHDGSTIDMANSADAPLDRAVGHLGKDRKGFPDGFGIATGASIDQPEMIGRKHVHQPPGDRAGVGRLASAAQLPDDGLARWGGTRDAGEIEREIIDQPEIGSSRANGQMLGQMPVRTERPHAQFGDRLLVAGSAQFAQRNEHVRAGIVGCDPGALLFD